MSVFGGKDIVNNDCVLYVQADNPDSYVTQSDTWFDMSPSKFTFIGDTDSGAGGAMGYEQSIYSGRLVMTGSATLGWLSEQPSSFASQLNFEFTMFGVVRETERSTFHTILSTDWANSYKSLSLCSNSGRLLDDHWEPNGRQSVSVQLALNTLYMVSWVCPDWQAHWNTNRLFVNGLEVASQNYAGRTTNAQTLATDPWKIGNWQPSRTDMDWMGEIEMVLVYDRAYTNQEVWETFRTFQNYYGL